jgi:hypothetical protein
VRSNDVRSGQSRIAGFTIAELPPYAFLNFGAGRPCIEALDDASVYWNVCVDGSAPSIADGEWHHVAMVIERDVLPAYLAHLYVDATETRSAFVQDAGAFGDATSPANFRIGGQNAIPSLALAGSIDEVRVYRRALSQAEVGELARGP